MAADDPATYLSAITEGPPDGILGIAQNFKACTAANKVNLVIGAYRTEEGEPWVLPSVKAAEQRLIDRNENKEYATQAGVPAFVEHAMRFAYGEASEPLKSGCVAAVQVRPARRPPRPSRRALRARRVPRGRGHAARAAGRGCRGAVLAARATCPRRAAAAAAGGGGFAARCVSAPSHRGRRGIRRLGGGGGGGGGGGDCGGGGGAGGGAGGVGVAAPLHIAARRPEAFAAAGANSWQRVVSMPSEVSCSEAPSTPRTPAPTPAPTSSPTSSPHPHLQPATTIYSLTTLSLSLRDAGGGGHGRRRRLRVPARASRGGAARGAVGIAA